MDYYMLYNGNYYSVAYYCTKVKKKCKYLFLRVIVYPPMMDGPEPKLLGKYDDQYTVVHCVAEMV